MTQALPEMCAEERQLRDRRQRHLTMLALSVAVLILSFALQVSPEQQVVMGGLWNRPLPPVCMSRAIWNIPCPGCGLTRSFIYLAHGDWQAAWQMHRIGWLMFAAVALQIPYRIAAVRFPHREVLGTIVPKLFGYTLIGLLFANWAVSMASTAP